MAQLISFVIPCYRSEKTIQAVVAEVAVAAEALSDCEYEIVLVNDGSPDDTFSVIRSLCEADTRIKGINLSKNFGQHAALMAGFRHVKGDIVVCLDDDGQTPAGEVNKLIEGIREGADVVYARYEHKQ
ncbi:MAG: glycosyltransferase, partial [Lachnospiraceae bacterium]|nr:glycosyltransferase [Lachnospiraceae bacterium]